MKTAEKIADKIESLQNDVDQLRDLEEASKVRSYKHRMSEEINEKLALIAALEWVLEVVGYEEI